MGGARRVARLRVRLLSIAGVALWAASAPSARRPAVLPRDSDAVSRAAGYLGGRHPRLSHQETPA